METTLEGFYVLLRAADWNYEYADGEVYRSGEERMRVIRRLTHKTETHLKMFNIMKAAGERGGNYPTFDELMRKVANSGTGDSSGASHDH